MQLQFIRNLAPLRLCAIVAALLSLASCGGGAGTSSGAIGSGGSSGGDAWVTHADISSNGCGERIAAVDQTFTVDQGGGNVSVNTGIITINGVTTDTGFTAGYSDANGDCTRTYTVTFSEMNGSTANVLLSSQSTCGSTTCENRWTGTASRG